MASCLPTLWYISTPHFHLAKADRMHYVYLLRSESHPKQTYVGFTQDLQQRLAEHNSGKSVHTRKFAPWKLAGCGKEMSIPGRRTRLKSALAVPEQGTMRG